MRCKKNFHPLLKKVGIKELVYFIYGVHMKIFSKRLLVAVALASSAGMVESATNKTFMMPRPTGVDLPMELTTFRRLDDVTKKHKKHLHGGQLQIAGFYSDSESENALGRYFGINNKSTIDFGANASDTSTSNVTQIKKDIDELYMLHWRTLTLAEANDVNAAKITTSLMPDQSAYGLRLDFYHNCDKIISGLYWYVNMPLVHIKQDVHVTTGLSDTTFSDYTNDFVKYLKGAFLGWPDSSAAPTVITHNFQEKLTHAKYAGRQTEIGIADIDLALGYKIFNTKKYDLGLAVALTIPTGNKPTGEYLFEPIVGNGHHVALGADLNGQFTLFGNRCHNLKANMYGKFRYLFESNEKRTLSLRRPDGTIINWGQYYLLGRNNPVAGALIPAANILTQNVSVRPGAQFDGVLGLQYNFRGFVFDLGYNFYARETEKVSLRDAIEEDTYAIAARNFDTAVAFDITSDSNVDGNNHVAGTITSDQANTTKTTIFANVAETNYQATHSIYGGIGYVAKNWTYPCFIGIGGKYEWKEENNAIEKWELWAKVGVGF